MTRGTLIKGEKNGTVLRVETKNKNLELITVKNKELEKNKNDTFQNKCFDLLRASTPEKDRQKKRKELTELEEVFCINLI